MYLAIMKEQPLLERPDVETIETDEKKRWRDGVIKDNITTQWT